MAARLAKHPEWLPNTPQPVSSTLEQFLEQMGTYGEIVGEDISSLEAVTGTILQIGNETRFLIPHGANISVQIQTMSFANPLATPHSMTASDMVAKLQKPSSMASPTASPKLHRVDDE